MYNGRKSYSEGPGTTYSCKCSNSKGLLHPWTSEEIISIIKDLRAAGVLLYLPLELLDCPAHKLTEECIMILDGCRLNLGLMPIRALVPNTVSLFKQINTAVGTYMAAYASFPFLWVRKIQSNLPLQNKGGNLYLNQFTACSLYQIL